MKNLIIVNGHCGTTLKAGKYLSEKLGNADIFDTQNHKNHFDFKIYDNFIFGSNMRMFMLNRRFKKWAKKLKKYYKTKNVYGYLVGCLEENTKGLEKLSKKLPNNKGVVYSWGEFAIENSQGQIKQMYENMKTDCISKGKELPHIRYEELEKLSNIILKNN